MYLSNSQALTHLSEESKIILNVTNNRPKDIHSILTKRDINPPVHLYRKVSSQGNSASQTESRQVNSLSCKLITKKAKRVIVMMMALETPDG